MKLWKTGVNIAQKAADSVNFYRNSTILQVKNKNVSNIKGLQSSLKTDTFQFEKFGKHKIPRFIYHMTDRESYKKILSDGYIKPSYERLFGNGIFAIELSNFFKIWSKTNVSAYEENLLERLLKHVCPYNKDNIVILKIPTKKLDHSKLVIRSQNRMFTSVKSVLQERERLVNIIQKLNLHLDSENTGGLIMAGLKIMVPEKRLIHLTKGTPAQYSKLFKQRKEAIEYIYKEPISVHDIEKLGEMNIPKSVRYNNVQLIKKMFFQVLKGKPEEKALKELSG